MQNFKQQRDWKPQSSTKLLLVELNQVITLSKGYRLRRLTAK